MEIYLFHLSYTLTMNYHNKSFHSQLSTVVNLEADRMYAFKSVSNNKMNFVSLVKLLMNISTNFS